METVLPGVVLDGAHNPQAAQALAETVRAWFPGKRAHFLMHIFRDKDASGILRQIAPVCASLTLTTIDRQRSADPTALGAIAAQFLPEDTIQLEQDFATALQNTLRALAPDDILIICGSLSHLETSRRLLAHTERIEVSW